MKWIKQFENFDSLNSITIIGAGISSLYAAYLLKKKYERIKITIIEKDSEVGGRVKMHKIGNLKLPTGAKSVRLDEDKIIISLLKELNIEIKPYKLSVDYLFDGKPVNNLVKKLQTSSGDRTTINQVLPKKLQNIDGYPNFEISDIRDTIFNYVGDDISGYYVADPDWDLLIQKLVQFIGKENIILNTEVKSITRSKSGWIVNSELESEGIILGVTVNQLKRLITDDIYDNIQSQGFIKIYNMSGDVQEIKDEVFTIEFTNISESDSFNPLIKTDWQFIKPKVEGGFEVTKTRKISWTKGPEAVNSLGLKKFIHDEGNHYYLPLKEHKSRQEFIYKAQHPYPGMWIIGEMISIKQGCVDGALMSVNNLDLFK